MNSPTILGADGGSWTRRNSRIAWDARDRGGSSLTGVDGIADEDWGPGSLTESGDGKRDGRISAWSSTQGGCSNGPEGMGTVALLGVPG